MYISSNAKKRNIKKIILITFISLVFISVLLIGDSHLRKILNEYSSSTANTIIINAANESISELLSENKIIYGDIVKLSRDENGKVTSLEIGIEQLNIIRSQIAVKIDEKLFSRSEYPIKIPIGTIIGNEFTIGRGPQVTFNMRLTSTIIADFESNFTSAGINQVLHQIKIKLKMSGKVIIPWYNSSFSTEMTCIVAQTVIVGATPEQFTNVSECEKDGIADDIFNFALN